MYLNDLICIYQKDVPPCQNSASHEYRVIGTWISCAQKNFEAYCWRTPTIPWYQSHRRRLMVQIVKSTCQRWNINQIHMMRWYTIYIEKTTSIISYLHSMNELCQEDNQWGLHPQFQEQPQQYWLYPERKQNKKESQMQLNQIFILFTKNYGYGSNPTSNGKKWVWFSLCIFKLVLNNILGEEKFLLGWENWILFTLRMEHKSIKSL